MSPAAKRLLKSKVRHRTVESLAVRDLATLAGEAGRRAHDRALKLGYRATCFVDGKLMYVYPDGRREPFAA